MVLPPEIRMMIYKLVLVSKVSALFRLVSDEQLYQFACEDMIDDSCERGTKRVPRKIC